MNTNAQREEISTANLIENDELSLLIQEMIAELRGIYGDILNSVVLYGSYARGEQNDDSDIDIALFVRKSDNFLNNSMIECVAAYELKTEKVLSVIDILQSKYDCWKNTLPFYKNINKEGIVLWKAA